MNTVCECVLISMHVCGVCRVSLMEVPEPPEVRLMLNRTPERTEQLSLQTSALTPPDMKTGGFGFSDGGRV